MKRELLAIALMWVVLISIAYSCTPKQQEVVRTAIDIARVICTREQTVDACIGRFLRSNERAQVIVSVAPDGGAVDAGGDQ